jgi:predicted transcriptional regulator of viral defense system
MINYDIIYEYAADRYGLITSSEAKMLGIPNVELVKLAHRGKLRRLGHGVYRIAHYIPTIYDEYAEAVTLVGHGAAIYGESVLALHGLALVNPSVIHIATHDRVRKKLPAYIRIVHPRTYFSAVEYEGIPSQSVYDALISCRATVMKERLIVAVSDAERQGLITTVEAGIARVELQ